MASKSSWETSSFSIHRVLPSSYFSEYLLRNCSTGKARPEQTRQCSAHPDEMPSANWSKFLLRFHPPLALHLLCTLSVEALAEAVSDMQLLHYSDSALTAALYWELAVYFPKCIHVKVLYQGSDPKKENRTSTFRVWSTIKRFLLSWMFGLNPWSCPSIATFFYLNTGFI